MIIKQEVCCAALTDIQERRQGDLTLAGWTHLGVSARVQSGNFVWGGNSHRVHSKQGVTPGRMTLAWPLRPSVPPSTMGLMVDRSGWPSSSYSVQRDTTLMSSHGHINHIYMCLHRTWELKWYGVLC